MKSNFFKIALISQLLCLVIVNLADFMMGLWTYQKFSSLSMFTIISSATLMPEILLSPIAGLVIDKVGISKAIKIGQFGAVFSLIALQGLIYNINIMTIVSLIVLSSAMNTLLFISLPLLIANNTKTSALVRMNALVQIGFSISRTLAPAIAGLLLVAITPKNFLMITSLFVFFNMLLVSFLPEPIHSQTSLATKNLRQTLKMCFEYFTKDKLLYNLVIFCCLINLCLGIVQALFIPLILNSVSKIDYAYTLFLCGMGMLFGSLLVLVWGGPKDKINGVIFSAVFIGFILSLSLIPITFFRLASASFLLMMLIVILRCCETAIWQMRVDKSILGSVYGLKSTLIGATLPIAYLISSPLIDYIIRPLYNRYNNFGTQNSLESYITFLFFLLGIFIIIFSVLAYLNLKLRMKPSLKKIAMS